MAAATLSPSARAAQTLTYNMKLLGHHELDGFGGIGEGCTMQLTKDGRRILWMAPRVGAEELHRGRCNRPAEAEDGRADRTAAQPRCAPIRSRSSAT